MLFTDTALHLSGFREAGKGAKFPVLFYTFTIHTFCKGLKCFAIIFVYFPAIFYLLFR